MATLSITIPDAQVTRIQDAFVAAYHYTPADGPLNAFIKKKVIAYIKEVVKSQEAPEAAKAAADAASQAVETEIVLT